MCSRATTRASDRELARMRERARKRKRDKQKGDKKDAPERKKDAPVSASSEFKSPGALKTIAVEALAVDCTTAGAAISAIYEW